MSGGERRPRPRNPDPASPVELREQPDRPTTKNALSLADAQKDWQPMYSDETGEVIAYLRKDALWVMDAANLGVNILFEKDRRQMGVSYMPGKKEPVRFRERRVSDE
jgi:hypothetical protein